MTLTNNWGFWLVTYWYILRKEKVLNKVLNENNFLDDNLQDFDKRKNMYANSQELQFEQQVIKYNILRDILPFL